MSKYKLAKEINGITGASRWAIVYMGRLGYYESHNDKIYYNLEDARLALKNLKIEKAWGAPVLEDE